ncbi:MAG: hypothetical protein Ct9H300mP16_15550 [Pseudomonadota bacterium]|nr:MAG: hypothetical protein Ct9H300mP16_15550 [Pseudomonadota bacterium]
MDGRNNKSLDDQMSVLTAKIDDLIQTCGRLQTENQQLSLEKNELARARKNCSIATVKPNARSTRSLSGFEG